jgi:deoxyribonuclease IV
MPTADQLRAWFFFLRQASQTMSMVSRIRPTNMARAAHLNDAKVDLGSRKDRHDSIGRGKLGLDAFRLVMNDPRFDGLPLVMETIDEALWPGEIELLYSLVVAEGKHFN